MKHYILVLFAAVLFCTLASCGKKEEAAKQEQDTTKTHTIAINVLQAPMRNTIGGGSTIPTLGIRVFDTTNPGGHVIITVKVTDSTKNYRAWSWTTPNDSSLSHFPNPPITYNQPIVWYPQFGDVSTWQSYDNVEIFSPDSIVFKSIRKPSANITITVVGGVYH